MSKAETAVESFKNGLNCSQAVLSAFGPDLGLDRETCVRIAGPFGGGIGHIQEVCGAVSGAAMVLGLKHGGGTDQRDRRDRIIEMTQEFIQEFRDRTGAIHCRDLLKCDITTRSGLLKARERGAFNDCAGFIRVAVELLEKRL